MIRHSNCNITDKTLRSMLARELLGIRNLRWRLAQDVHQLLLNLLPEDERSPEMKLKMLKTERDMTYCELYWMVVAIKTAYSHINEEFVAMEAELWQTRMKHQG